MAAKEWSRQMRPKSNWQNLTVRTVDTGERWAISWDTQRKPGADGRNRAEEKNQRAALERARHLLRMGFVVYEIRDPAGALFLDEAHIRQHFGLAPAAA
jgi:hypothetical protein